MAVESPANGVTTTLSSSITSTATTLPLVSATGFPNGQYAVLLSDGTNVEVCEASSISGLNLTVTRAAETWGGAATSYAFGAGTKVTIVISVGSVERLITSNAVPLSTVTTAGDLIVGSGASAVSRLGIGSNGQVLEVVSGAPAWTTPSAGALTSYSGTAAVNCGHAGATTTLFTTATLPTGTYLINVSGRFYASDAGASAVGNCQAAVGTATASFSSTHWGTVAPGVATVNPQLALGFTTLATVTVSGTLLVTGTWTDTTYDGTFYGDMTILKIA